MNTVTGVSNIATVAKIAQACFETARRTTGDTDTGPREDGDSYVRVKDGSPEWITDLAREAHLGICGLMLPDDWRYACISAAVDAIADGAELDGEGHSFADDYVDIYNADRLAWLASSGYRPSYVDQAQEDGLTSEDADLLERIGIGQYLEALEVFSSVWRSLTDHVEDDDSEDDDA